MNEDIVLIINKSLLGLKYMGPKYLRLVMFNHLNSKWIAPWRCKLTGKQHFSFAPDFSGFNPNTGELWSPNDIVESLGLKVESSDNTRLICEQVINDNPKEVALYKSGKTNLVGFFVKKVLDATNKQANPKEASQIIAELLNV